MKINIATEATNPSSIGSYKNTAFTGTPVKLRPKEKPEKGSYINWHKSKLNEAISKFFESWGMDVDNAVELVYTYILQADRWDFSKLVDNEELTAAELDNNEELIKKEIHQRVIPVIHEAYQANSEMNPSDINSLMSKDKRLRYIIDGIERRLNTALRSKTEGFLDNLRKAAGVTLEGANFQTLIKPRTVDNLYDGIVYQLQQRGRSGDKAWSEGIIGIFFPESAKLKAPEGIKLQLVQKYKDKMDDVIINYIKEDAQDVVNRLQQMYLDKDKLLNEITSDMYFGTIIDRAVSADYDMLTQLRKIYTAFEEECKKEEWQTSEAEDTVDLTPTEATSKLDKTVAEIAKKFGTSTPEAVKSAIVALLQSDTAMSLIKGYLSSTGGK